MAITSKQNIFALASVGIDIGKEVFHLVGFDLVFGLEPRQDFSIVGTQGERNESACSSKLPCATRQTRKALV